MSREQRAARQAARPPRFADELFQARHRNGAEGCAL
jgi:hypothetical protein